MSKVTTEYIKECLNHVASTPEGQIVLYMLMLDCHWDDTYIAKDNPLVAHFHAGKRGIWGGLRKNINKEYLKVIENDYQIEKKTDIDPSKEGRISRRGKRDI